MQIFKSKYPDVPLRDISITECVFENLQTRPAEVVLTDSVTGETLTAAGFMDQVQRLAGGLVAQHKGRVIAIMAPNCPAFCVAFHGIAYAGGTITTLNPTYTASEIQHQLKDSGASLLITVPALKDVATKGIEGTGVSGLTLIGEPSFDALFGPPLTAQVPVDLDTHPAALPYSSGTTGLPKGVILSHRNLVVNIDQSLPATGFEPGEVAAAFLPFFHIYGLTALMNLHLAGGGALVTMPRFDLAAFLQIAQDYKTKRMWIAPPVAIALAKHPLVDEFDLSSLKVVFCAAAPLGAEVSDAVAARLDCTCLQGYGMTELAPVSHVVPDSAPRTGAAGLAVGSTQCRIIDIETGADLGVDQEGELWVKGPQVMIGYHANPAATQATITDGWLRTGDIAKVDADGYLFIMDRLKELIKYNGFQVAPAELEATLVAMDGVIDAAVVGKPDDTAGELPIAFVVIAEDGPTDEDIHAYFAANLSKYKQLHALHRVSEIPKSASGKILRRLLRDQL